MEERMKKTLALIFAIVMVVCATATALAAPGPDAKITGMAQPLAIGYSGDPDLGDITPQDERIEYIDIVDAMFTWDGYTPEAATPTEVPSRILRDARVDVHASGSRVVESVELDASRSRVEVRFVRELASIRKIDFDFDVVLSVNGRRRTDYPVTFTGTLANPEYEVYEDSGYEDISGGEVAEAREYIRSIVLDAGAGVSITTRMMEGDLVYAVASRTPSSEDEDVFAASGSIQDVIHLRTSGVSGSAGVSLDKEFAGYYVYDGEGAYLGMGGETLPLRAVYYLSDGKIKAGGERKDNGPEPGAMTGPEPELAPQPGGVPISEDIAEPSVPGDDTSPYSNVNHNPNTGR
jgi:hypothetical protein